MSAPAWIVGAGGLLAGELLRLVAEHPRVETRAAVTREGGESLAALHPHLAAALPVVGGEALPDALAEALETGSEPVLLLALPHGGSSTLLAGLQEALGPDLERVTVVDLAADHRLRDPERRTRWYGASLRQEASDAFVYGLPELAGGELEGARRVAAPGCFATALQLATLPAAREGWLDPARPWTFHGVTGSSGSGAKPGPGTHHPHRHGDLWAYAPEGHRHEAELEQALERHGLAPALALFPCSGPYVRGIHLTALLPLREALPLEEARAAYAAAYEGRPFVAVLPAGGTAHLRAVVGSNRAELALARRADLLVVSCVLDNVLKGGAGQAVQALNVARGWPEAAGLPRHGLGAL